MAAVVGTNSYWLSSTSFPGYPPLRKDERADVVVIGAGVTGLTAAYLFASAGASVVVLERETIAGVDSGHTTAHLTMVTDTRLNELVKRFGRDHAQAVWEAGLAAIVQIDDIVRTEEIDCDFTWIDGYLHAAAGATDAEIATLREDAALAEALGFDASFVEDVPLVHRAGIRFENQARIHAGKYLAGLAQAIVRKGGRIYEHSGVNGFVETPRSVTANGHAVTCRYTVVATHTPLVGRRAMLEATLFQTKLALYSSYVVAGRVRKQELPDALLWDTGHPYHYYRLQPVDAETDLVIYGGEDHKTGQARDTGDCFARVESALRTLVPSVEIVHRWSGQVVETPDGLPFIGEQVEGEFDGTGYAGNGMTFGTLTAMMASDAAGGRRNPWRALFDPNRTIVHGGTWDYLKENVSYPYYFLRDRVAGSEGKSLRAVGRGEGKIVDYRGQKTAASRDDQGQLSLCSAICTHLGCVVGWNAAEHTWDCPCHGSRFTPNGQVISGPAESPLSAVLKK
jgi:glycine/D-amino acid oxidase-like deaminating enzyme/nitrite reductase/ring-hydroxylating ferredoxin subunit